MSQRIGLLRGVTPNGKNRIPNMAYLAAILQEAGYKRVRTYLQSGNLVLESDTADEVTKQTLHDLILEKIGADLTVILKEPSQIEVAIAEQPFADTLDSSRIHLVFTNDCLSQSRLNQLLQEDFGEELLVQGSECLYLYFLKRRRESDCIPTIWKNI